ncbi:AbrB/MazE/SpoVT family DNA-binding domain-containing protein [Brevibacillus sp. 179-C9.3 HS]|uniref:AbrB/MazE/SpoVT family DNA-binding domain-containing protein n=1 Tax=unclassified Brevibacillus TaxID=2684853 RepID=UPI0039A32D9A
MDKPFYSRVSSKGQVVIPSVLRDQLNIEQGSLLFFQPLSHNTIAVRVITEHEQFTPIVNKQTNGKIPSVGLKRTF